MTSQAAAPPVVTFYHDVEQDFDSDASPQRCRDIVHEFLAIEARAGVRATYNVVGRIFEEQQELVQRIAAGGHEVAFHSYDHPRDWTAAHSAGQIKRCRATSPSVNGYRSPRSQLDARGVESLWEHGFRWNAEADNRDEPYFLYKGLVRLPIFTDDWPLHQREIALPEYVARFSDALRRRRYVAIGFHDTVASEAPEERLKLWEQLLRLAIDRNCTIATFAETADLFRRAAVARYYTDTARDWNQRTRSLYRTRRLQEIISDEAHKLHSPTVADLGSGGGVLTSPIGEHARVVYCVDNSAGMVAEAEAHKSVHAVLGEATDSHLPPDTCDLVVCARIIEYVFEPEALANEISRIGKIGATFIVTFPALLTPPSNDGTPPDRIRRHFTPADIRRWAEPIGAGRLVPLQFDSAEPADADSERRYRLAEANPPADRQPTNWVFIGTIEHRTTHPTTRTLPLAASPFQLAGERSSRITHLIGRAARRVLRGMRTR